eukprot:6209302-Pleurochrysis_carterae.AAC.2
MTILYWGDLTRQRGQWCRLMRDDPLLILYGGDLRNAACVVPTERRKGSVIDPECGRQHAGEAGGIVLLAPTFALAMCTVHAGDGLEVVVVVHGGQRRQMPPEEVLYLTSEFILHVIR